MKPFFSDKTISNKKITLIGDTIISDDIDVAETMNIYFINAVKELQIRGFKDECSYDEKSDNISRIKFNKHPSIIKIKENVVVGDKITFSPTNLKNIEEKIVSLNMHKPTTLHNIPAKILVQYKDICSKYIYKFYNNCIRESVFPDPMKMADITPAHKKMIKQTNKITDPLVFCLPYLKSLKELSMKIFPNI